MLEHQDYPKEEILHILSIMKWSASDDYYVARIEYRNTVSISPYIVSSVEMVNATIKQCCSFIHENGICVLVNMTHAQKRRDEVGTILAEDMFCCGISYHFFDFFRFPEFYRQACQAVRYSRYHPKKAAVIAEHIALGEVSSHARRNSHLSTYIHNDVISLVNYDSLEHTEFAKTLFYVLAYGGNTTDAANALKIHRNIVLYRMNQLQNLTTSNLHDENQRLLLLISFIMHGFHFSD